jgi:hypothetical protein
MKVLDDVEVILLADETKFSVKDGDAEDAIYYFALCVNKDEVPVVSKKYSRMVKDFQLERKGFHSTKAFKEKNPNPELMSSFCTLIIASNIKCLCFKYPKQDLHKPTEKAFEVHSKGVFDFSNHEFQALFYFIQTLNILPLKIPHLVRSPSIIFFDRNVYRHDNEFELSSHNLLKRMVFVRRNKIKLLALPDYFGYIFRKAKISQNKVQYGDMSLEKSELVINSYNCVLKIRDAGLFFFLDVNEWLNWNKS